MKIGLVSDTHDRLPFIDRAVNKLNEENVELVLHAGDYSAPFAAYRFKPLRAKMIGVFGNNDAERSMLQKNFKAIGADVHGKFAEIDVDEVKIALLHGDETSLLSSLINTNAFDVIVFGHTHQAEIRKEKETLVVNPGEVCGYLSGKATIALLDTQTLEVKLHEI